MMSFPSDEWVSYLLSPSIPWKRCLLKTVAGFCVPGILFSSQKSSFEPIEVTIRQKAEWVYDVFSF